MTQHQIGKYIIAAGFLIIVIGVIFFFFGNIFKWVGRLPGDIRIENEQTRFYFPIVSMIIISLLLTVIVNILKRFL